jgi:hypothetical protein
MLFEEEQRIVNECLATSIEDEQKQEANANAANYFNKYIQLRKYLNNNEQQFIDLQQTSLKAIRQVYSLLTNEQKLKLIRKLINNNYYFNNNNKYI